MSRYRSEIIVCLFLIITTLAVYWQTLNFDFIICDDTDYVTENLHVRAGWTVEGAVWAFTTKFHRHWHPLTWLSHMTDCQLFGLNPAGHHLSSLFLHLANTVLLFFVFKLMTGTLWRSAFVAALFALHPLHVEPVAWISVRKDLLCTFFWMLAMLAYVRYSKSPGFCRYVPVLLAFILGLMAKSMVVTLPFVLLLMDYWPLKRSRPGQSKGERNTGNRKFLNFMYQKLFEFRLIWEKALLFIFVGAASVVTLSAMQQQTVLNVHTSRLLRTEHLIANASYISYICKTFWPLNLAVPYPDHSATSAWQSVGYGLLLIFITFLVFWKRRQYPYLLVGWLWYLITLMPVVGIVGYGPTNMFDRYTYLPLIGLFIIIAWGVPDLLKAWRYQRIVLAISTGILLLCLITLTWFQVQYWKDSATLFNHSLDVTVNNYKAHNIMGVIRSEQGKAEEAFDHYYRSLSIKPNYEKTHYNLGVILAEQGKREEAIDHYYKAIRLKPRRSMAHYNLGLLLAQQGRLEEAIDHYYKAIKFKPDYAKSHYNLGLILAQQGKLEEAIDHYYKAISIKPDYAKAHYNLGVFLTKQGKLEEAIKHYSKAISIKPDYAKAHRNLEHVLRLMGKSTEGS